MNQNESDLDESHQLYFNAWIQCTREAEATSHHAILAVSDLTPLASPIFISYQHMTER